MERGGGGTPKGEAAPEEHNLSFIQLANEAKEPDSDRRIDGGKKKEPSASRRRLLRTFTPPISPPHPPTPAVIREGRWGVEGT